MNKNWFKKMGWIYQPVSWQGALVTFLLILFLVQVFIAIDRNSHSVSDTLYGIFPYWIPAILVWLWIGSKTNQQDR
ncbi:hypothetical protein HY972_03225 [Candidatus Kaiserbacteria bacterium]|nr:hypothetical protein [Candidatus Kaiserbacteria bacterium]